MNITVSGRTYSAACDPKASDVPREEGWPTPVLHKHGRGWQHAYPWDDKLAEQIASHLEDLAGTFVHSDDADTRAEGRACALDADRIRKQQRELSATNVPVTGTTVDLNQARSLLGEGIHAGIRKATDDDGTLWNAINNDLDSWSRGLAYALHTLTEMGYVLVKREKRSIDLSDGATEHAHAYGYYAEN